VTVIIKMRAFKKIILFGAVLASLSFICSTFSCLTDTYAAFGDAKNVDVNLNAATWDTKANLVELSDSKLPANKEKTSESTFTTMENPKASASGNNSRGENSSNNGSSVNDLVSDCSVAGNYTINLTTNNSTLSNENCRGSLDSSTVLKQPTAVLPVANFNSNFTSGYAPLSVQFTDFSTNATKWNWDFGDGNISTEQNPVHTYSASGSYTVTLAASNENGTNSTFSTMTVLQTVLPVANFSSNFTIGYTPLSVQFTDLSDNATGWNWDFGDGNISTEQNPMHTYSVAGNYTVNLIATNAAFQSTKIRLISVDKKIGSKRDFCKQKTP